MARIKKAMEPYLWPVLIGLGIFAAILATSFIRDKVTDDQVTEAGFLLPDFTEYNCEAGQTKFSPGVFPWPIWGMNEFAIVSEIDSTSYFGVEDFMYGEGELDRDFYDWLKIGGVTQYLSRGNNTSALIAFRPSEVSGSWEVCGYTNYPGTDWQVTPIVTVRSNQRFLARATFEAGKILYMIQADTVQMKTDHEFKGKLRLARRINAWAGGENNSVGPYGGAAPRDMKLFIDFSKN